MRETRLSIIDIVPPDQAGLSASDLDRAVRLLSAALESGFIPGLATAIYRRSQLIRVAYGGTRNPEEPTSSVERDTLFLIASLTKPIVCAGALLLLQEGAFSLDQPVHAFIPEFGGHGKEDVLIRHLFTHTSGLPDQLPESPELRARHAPLQDFVKATCAARLLFSPGTHVSYQSMGILMIGEMVERLAGMRLRDYLRLRLFEPLGMRDSTLGMPPTGMSRAAYSLPATMPHNSRDVGGDWNTPYWRDIGAPWGGLHSTVEDLGRFLMHMLGESDCPLSPATRGAMTRDQIAAMPGISAEQKLTDRWGLGWKLGGSRFGDLVSGSTFGHHGSTGAVYWADPRSGLACVLLTNQPALFGDTPSAHQALAPRYANALCSSLLPPLGS